MTDDIAELKARVDLAALVGADLGPSRRQRGRWHWWLCPFHAETRPSFGVTPDNGRFKCFGCGAGGDHLDYLERRQGLSTAQALAELRRWAALPETKHQQAAGMAATTAGDAPPPAAWQVRARAFLAYAREQLGTDIGRPGRDYLGGGGLTVETMRRFGLGWNPRDLWDDPQHWGLSGARVYLPRGVVIPCGVGGSLWYVKVRRFERDGHPRIQAGEKYGGPRGGKGALFGADHLRAADYPLLLCEGERDALLAIQELSDLVDVATLGGAGRRCLGHWLLWLLPYRRILAAYDADGAGRQGAAHLESLSGRVQGIRVPHGKDLTGFHAEGGDLRAWLGSHLAAMGMAPISDRQIEAATILTESPATAEQVADWARRYEECMAGTGVPGRIPWETSAAGQAVQEG
jgi:DNA primase